MNLKDNHIKIIFYFLFVVLPVWGTAQNFQYSVLFEGIGDNREFFSGKAKSQTILGSRGGVEAGISHGHHYMRGGLSQLLEFGSDIDYHTPRLTLYYLFSNEKKDFLFGAFPRRGRIDFPLAMLTDTLLYYRPNIEGLFGEARWDWGHQNGFVDWVSRQTDINRENFMAGFSGQVFYKSLFFENHLLLFHDAGPSVHVPGDHIKDYLGFALQAGIRTYADPVQSGYLKAGILGSSFRERSVTNGFMNSLGFFAEANGRWHNYGLKTVLHSGSGHRFAYGDLFYRLDNYWRTDVIWYFINHKNVRGKFNLSFHILDWDELDQQQQLTIVYVFGN
jgi:hypothetical protein